jgi:hypothetical protein
MKLTRLEYVWAEAALGSIFPGSDGEGLAGIGAMNVRAFMGDVLRTVPFQAALGLRAAIWLIALSPLLLLGRLTTIVHLAQGDRESLVSRLVASRWYAIRSLVLLLKTIGALLYAGDDGVRSRMMHPTERRELVALRHKSIHAA